MPQAIPAILATALHAVDGIAWVNQLAQALTVVAASQAVDAVVKNNSKVKDQGGLINLELNPSPPRRLVVGKRAVGGTLVDWYLASTNNTKLYLPIYLSEGPCGTITKVWAGGRVVWSTPLVHGVRTAIPDFRSGGDRVWLTYYDGRVGQTADATLIANSAGGWTSANKMTGCAYVIVELQWDSDNLRTPPSFVFEHEGAKFYDRRKDSTAGGSGLHRLTDPATWDLGDAEGPNPMVALDHFQLGRFFNGQRVFGIGMPSKFVPYDKFAAQANVCDENVTLKAGGTQKRYRANGVITANEPWDEIIKRFCTAMVAQPADFGGRVGVVGIEARTPVMTIEDDDIPDMGSEVYIPKRTFGNLVGVVRGKYQEPAQIYQPVPYAEVSDPAWNTQDGAEPREFTFDLEFETNPERAERLATLKARYERRQATLTGVYPYNTIELERGDWFVRSGPVGSRFGTTGKTFEVMERIFDPETFTVTINAQEVDPADSAWDQSLAADPPPAPVSGTATLSAVQVPAITVTAISLTGTLSSVPALRIQWTAPTDPRVRFLYVEVENTDGTTPKVAKTIALPSDANFIVVSEGVADGEEYGVSAKFLSDTLQSEWCIAAIVFSSGAFATGAASSVPWSGVTGAGKPADNATVGGTFGVDVRETNGGTVALLAAFKTILGQAATIVGQGNFATVNSVANGSAFLTGFGGLSALAFTTFGTNVRRADATTIVTDALAITSLGQAATIVGQGNFATQSSVAYGSAFLTGFGSLAPLGFTTFGTNVRRADGTTIVTDALAITSLGQAATIVGQGNFATQSSVAYGSAFLTGFGSLAPLGFTTFGTNVRRADGTTVVTDALAITSLGQAATIVGQQALATLAFTTFGTNVRRADGTTIVTDALAITSLGQAATIAGQGNFATQSSVAYGSAFLTGFGSLAPLGFTTFGTNVRRADGTTVVTDALAITSLGQAASITGQGSGALANNLAQLNATDNSNLNSALAGIRRIGDVKDFSNDGLHWTTTFGGTPDAVADPVADGYFNVADIGRVIRLSATAYLTKKAVFKPIEGRRYLQIVRLRAHTNPSSGVMTAALSNINGLDINYAHGAGVASATITPPNAIFQKASFVTADGWITLARVWVAGAASTYNAYWRLRLDITQTGAGGKVEVAAFDVLDVTDMPVGRSLADLFRADGTTALTDATVVTSLGQAATIVGQGNFATQSSVAYGSAFLTGFGTLAPLAFTTLGSNVRQSNGSTIVTDATAITSLGQAATIVGQGNFATQSSVAYGSAFLTGFGSLAPLGFTSFGNNVRRADGATVVTDAAAITSLGQAATIVGQGNFATVSSVAYGSAFLTGFGSLAPLSGIRLGGPTTGYSGLLNEALDTWLNNGQIITSLGQAATIAGQGWGATASEDAARAERDGLTKNSRFDQPFTGPGIPPGWGDWSNGAANTTYITKPIGDGKCIQINAAANADGGIQQQVFVAPSQDYVITGEIRRQSGSTNSAGIHCQFYNASNVAVGPNNLNFATEATTAGVTTTTPDGIQRWEKVVTAPADATYCLLYAMSHWGGFGRDMTVANSIAWYECSITPMSLVRQLRADVTGSNQSGSFAGQGALATLNSISYGSGQAIGFGSLAALSSIAGLQAGSIAGQGWGATASEASASNAQVAFGDNMLVNTDWSESTDGWYQGWDGDSGIGITRGMDLAGWSGSPVRTSYFVINGTPVAGKVADGLTQPQWETLASLKRYSPRVTPGDRLHCSYYMGMHRCTGRVVVGFFNGAGTYIAGSEFNSTTGAAFADGNPANAERVGGFLTVPAGAMYMAIVPRMVTIGGQASPYLFHGWPMVAKVGANQTTPPPYKTGQADRYVDYTPENQAASFFGQAALATLSFVQLSSNVRLADGTTIATNALLVTSQGQAATVVGQGALATKNVAGAGDISVASLSAISATIGTLRTAISGPRVEIKDNIIEVYDANRLRVQLGIWT
jgi:hypothetical protein